MADKPPMHGGLSAAPNWFGGALLPHEICRVSASLGCIRLFYSTNWANYATLMQARTQETQQHTTTNMSRRRPTHQRLWSSLSMATSAMDLDLGTPTLYGSEAGTGHSVRSRRYWFRQVKRRNRAPEKIERSARLWSWVAAMWGF